MQINLRASAFSLLKVESVLEKVVRISELLMNEWMSKVYHKYAHFCFPPGIRVSDTKWGGRGSKVKVVRRFLELV